MSTIPPNIVGPILQSGATQQQAARALENERAQQSEAVATGNKMSERATEAVGETDNDARVHADSEGTGSQGRHAGEENAEKKHEEAHSADRGIRRDQDGQLHVDLEA